MKTFLRLVLPLVLLSLIILQGCSLPPTGSQVKVAIRRDLEKFVPTELSKTVLPASKGVLTELKVNKVGDIQKIDGKEYYPVMVFARGTCTAVLGNEVPFDGDFEYYLWKDPYGEWSAAHRKDLVWKKPE